MHYLYILYSDLADKYYIGETYNIQERITKHNTHQYGDAFTKIANDWQVVLLFECIDEEEAVFLEKFIKRMKSRNFIARAIKEPVILKDILSKRM